MPTAGIVVFTRDLRVHDHVPLARAVAEHDLVVPLFVFDDAILGSAFNCPNRTGFLLESLTDLDDLLAASGARLARRRGPWVETVMQVARAHDADAIHLSRDVSGYARGRMRALGAACRTAGVRLELGPGPTVIEAGAITPGGGDHYQVFTPYYRRWSEAEPRAVAPTPGRIAIPDGLDLGPRPELAELVDGARAPDVMRGGASEAQRRLDAWLDGTPTSGLDGYDARHDDLAGDATSRLSPYLHFGCVSALEVAQAVAGHAGAEPFLRQLCWRDFFHQILAARPDAAWSDYRPGRPRRDADPDLLAAWEEGRTGYPVVDAGMRQLAREGFVHNRARMIVASFLTKDLGIDWPTGARHFLDHLVDGDLANNNLNWQWVAGTGTDTNPHRIFNPTVQGQRFDPDGAYVRRYVPELAALRGRATHEPDATVRRAYGYPEPIVDHHEAIAAYKSRRP